MTPLGHLKLLSRAVAVTAEMEISPQNEMANPQCMKVLPLRDMGFLKISCLSVLCVVCNCRRLHLSRVVCLCVVRSRVRHREILCVSCLRSPELTAEVRREITCISSTHAQMDAYNKRDDRNGSSVRRARSRTAAESVSGLDVNQACLSHPNAFNSRHTTLPSSPNCKQHRMWELGGQCRELIAVFTQRCLSVLFFCRWSKSVSHQKCALIFSEIIPAGRDNTRYSYNTQINTKST